MDFLGMLEWVIGQLQVTILKANTDILLCPECVRN